MTDISKEAVERLAHDCDLGAGALRQSPSLVSILSDASTTLRALSARVEELEEHISDMLADQDCACGHDNPSDICMGHIPRYKRDVAAARLQALDEASDLARLRWKGWTNDSKVQSDPLICEDIAAAIEALKEKSPV